MESIKVICVVGSPIDCAAIIPTISPGEIIAFLYNNTIYQLIS
jgi:hypothetical protein